LVQLGEGREGKGSDKKKKKEKRKKKVVEEEEEEEEEKTKKKKKKMEEEEEKKKKKKSNSVVRILNAKIQNSNNEHIIIEYAPIEDVSNNKREDNAGPHNSKIRDGLLGAAFKGDVLRLLHNISANKAASLRSEDLSYYICPTELLELYG